MADPHGLTPYGPNLEHPSFIRAKSPRNEKRQLPDDDEDEDMDALIDDLESHDGGRIEEEEEVVEPGGAITVPEALLQTNPEYGLSESEVSARRKKYGWNQMKEEKENLILKFLSYFVGPIQFVMEVCEPTLLCLLTISNTES